MANQYVRWPTIPEGINKYATFADLPVSPTNGTLAITLDTDNLYVYDLGTVSWRLLASPSSALSIGTFDSGTASANGAHIDGGALIMQSASATRPGLMNTGSQTIAGAKTFNAAMVLGSTLNGNTITAGSGTLTLSTFTLTVGGNSSVNGAFSGSSSGTNTGDITIGTASGLSLTGQVLSLGLASAGVTGALSGADWSTFNAKQAALTIGNITDAGTDGIVITGGTGAIIGSGVSLAQHVADASHNGYLSSADWSTFNSKQQTVSFTTIGAVPNANGGDISSGVITLQPADASFGGLVTTTTQTFAGDKTFNGVVAAPSGAVNAVGLHLSTDVGTGFWRPGVNQLNVSAAGATVLNIGTSGLAVTGILSATSTLSASNFSGSSSGANTGDVTLGAVGSSPSANGASLSGQVLTLQPADATHPGVMTIGTQTLAGAKTWSDAAVFSTSITDSGLTATGIVYAGTAGLLSTSTAGSGAGVFYDSANSRFGLGIAAPATDIHVSSTGATTRLDRYGNVPGYQARRANGTIVSPTKVVSTDDILRISAGGYQQVSSAFGSTNTIIAITATQDYTDVAQGKKISFNTVPNGTTSATLTLTLDQDQSATFAAVVATPGYDTSTATSGTITMAASKSGLVINSAGGTTLTIKLPSSPIDGQKCFVGSVGAFTTVTWQDSGGTAGNVIGGQAALGGINRGQEFVYSAALTKWLAIS